MVTFQISELSNLFFPFKIPFTITRNNLKFSVEFGTFQFYFMVGFLNEKFLNYIMNFDINMNVHLLVSYEDKISNTSSFTIKKNNS
jgi:hypothetical protein